jgi:purine-nucleoside phosphorylase
MKSAGQAKAAIERLRHWRAESAVILGSGLNAIAPEAAAEQTIVYTDFEELPCPSVPGHSGRFVLGKINQARVIFAQGRVHLYEGFSGREVTAATRILAEAGAKTLVVTNAAGSANPQFAPGSWMMITDHINLTGTSPLVGTSRCDVQDPAAAGRRPYQSAPRFVDLTTAYSTRLRERFASAAKKIDMRLNEGIYAGLLGPQYETPAEVRMLQKLGADAVGMSTVLEVIQARALGLEVAGFSCLTNFATGISARELSHDEVLETGKNAAADFARLLDAAL